MDRLSETQQVEELYREIMADGDCITLKQLAVTGNDIKAAGLAEGKGIGELLSYLLNVVHEEPGKNERSVLLGLAKEKSSFVKVL